MITPVMSPDERSRFERMVNIHSINEPMTDPRAHDLWTGALYREGYGQFWMNNKMWPVHRLSKAASIIDGIPSYTMVLHVLGCEYRNCIKPDHLYLGDHKQNQIDKKLAGHALGRIRTLPDTPAFNRLRRKNNRAARRKYNTDSEYRKRVLEINRRSWANRTPEQKEKKNEQQRRRRQEKADG